MSALPANQTPGPSRVAHALRGSPTAWWLALGGSVVFVVLVLLLGHHAPPTGFDTELNKAVTANAPPGAVHAAALWSRGVPKLVELGLVLGVVLLVIAGQWQTAIVAFGAEVCGAGLVVVVKDWLDRARPVTGYGDPSFPSGHTTAGTVEWGLLLLVILPALRGDQRPTRLAWLAWILLAFVAGAARVVEGVHWGTDLVGGWSLGAAVVGGAMGLSAWRWRAKTGPSGALG